MVGTAEGTPITPIREVVLKARQDCNLACPNCYVYTGPDQSWQTKPVQMSDEVLERTAERMDEHMRAWNLPNMRVVYHGGEPLMNGADYYRRAARIFRAVMPPDRVEFSLQTNGVLLTRSMLAMLREEKVCVGVSLDGPPAVHDQARPAHNGRGSFAAADRALRLLSGEFRDVFGGVLCTIDPASNPREVYDAVTAYDPPRLDLLIRHATWDSPPDRTAGPTAVGTWLVNIFDHWATDITTGRPQMKVRLFDSVLSGLLHGVGRSEQIGLAPVNFALVESDGSYEGVDSLKVVGEGAPATGLNVFEHSFNDVLATPAMRARQLGLQALSATCRECPLVRTCGGGHYVHRFSSANGFDNPTVYCPDMKVLIPHVAKRVLAFGIDPSQLTIPLGRLPGAERPVPPS